MRRILATFCIFLVIGCPKKPKKDVAIPEREYPEEFEELLDELHDENLDDLPEDTADE